MGYKSSFKHGDHKANCDRCGGTYKASELIKTWDGLYVDVKCWEPRHPQDFVKGLKDDPTPPFTRPQSSSDTSTTDISGNSLANINTITTVGDADKTLTVGTDLQIQEWNTTLTANRTVTLATSAGIRGDQFMVHRSAGGAFTLDVGGLYTIPASIQEIVIVEFTGSVWVLFSHTPSGL